MDIQAAAEDAGIEQVLVRLTGITKFGDRKFMQKIAKNWLAHIHAEFITGSNPYGIPWQDLSPRTIKLKKAAGMVSPAKKLFATGALSKSFFMTAGPIRARVETSLPELAARHNQGIGVGSEPPHAPIPPRQIMPAPDDLPASWQIDVDQAFAELMVDITR